MGDVPLYLDKLKIVCNKIRMPRQSRIDAPGALHHIIIRGIEKKQIFKDDADRDNFVERLKNILKGDAAFCFAWSLMPNHVHLLLKTGKTSISTIMRRLLTGYAVYFNRKHARADAHAGEGKAVVSQCRYRRS